MKTIYSLLQAGLVLINTSNFANADAQSEQTLSVDNPFWTPLEMGIRQR